MTRLVGDFLAASAARSPAKLALVVDEQRFTYAELQEQVHRLARALVASGVRRGDRVVLWSPNGVELVVGIFAVLAAGGVFVVLHETTKADRVAYVVGDCGAVAVAATAVRLGALRGLPTGSPQPRFAIELPSPERRLPLAPGDLDYSQALAEPCTEPFAGPVPRPAIDRDLACLIYTSGSTGAPKGVMSAHHNVVFAVESITTYLRNTADDVVLCALPLSFDYGLYQLLMVFAFGGRLVLERSFAYPAAILERVASERVTGLPGVPTMWSILLGLDLAAFDLRTLRYVTNTAAALPPSHVQRLQAALPKVQVVSMYGLTETKRALYMPPEQLAEHPGSVGIAIPGTEVWIEDDDGRRLGPGEVGELIVRGGHVMLGYWGAPEATARRFRPGPWPGEHVCHTGDLFRADEQGFHYFVGRRDDVLKCRGEKVAPKEVEAVLHELPGVREAAVVGVADAVLGQSIHAYVVRNDLALTEVAVLRHCRGRLEDFKVPQVVVFVGSLPQTSTGKVHRAGLGEHAAEAR